MSVAFKMDLVFESWVFIANNCSSAR